ncbi:MAG: STAS domain-containing protein [Gammaproteobacteria bacterium]
MKSAANPPGATIQAVSASQGDNGRFLVSGALVFDTVPELMKQAQRLFATVDRVVVDFSGVQHCNSSGLAVILEMARLMRRQNKTICFQSLPQQIHTFARAYSVDEELAQAGLLC